jgi:hypothetical protein
LLVLLRWVPLGLVVLAVLRWVPLGLAVLRLFPPGLALRRDW